MTFMQTVASFLQPHAQLLLQTHLALSLQLTMIPSNVTSILATPSFASSPRTASSVCCNTTTIFLICTFYDQYCALFTILFFFFFSFSFPFSFSAQILYKCSNGGSHAPELTKNGLSIGQNVCTSNPQSFYLAFPPFSSMRPRSSFFFLFFFFF